MGAARWCFVLICHTLLTERERRREQELEEEEQKEAFTIAKSEHSGLKQTPLFKSSSASSSPLVSPDGAVLMALPWYTLPSRMHTGEYRHNTPQIARLGIH
ncbi:hypothetical protein XENOCAPTIV_025428 [Xenoophorus captivus]|uniref:Secreted protein n=1 Tax=Xenoophorus captivus TaxID=1517983 RepID=A0ABV0RLA7_9TELE